MADTLARWKQIQSPTKNTPSKSKSNKNTKTSSTSPDTVMLLCIDDFSANTSITSSCFSQVMTDTSDRSTIATRSQRTSLTSHGSSGTNLAELPCFIEEDEQQPEPPSATACSDSDHVPTAKEIPRRNRRPVRSTALSVFSSSGTGNNGRVPSLYSVTKHNDEDGEDSLADDGSLDNNSLDSLDKHYNEFHSEDEEETEELEESESGFDLELEYLADSPPHRGSDDDNDLAANEEEEEEEEEEELSNNSGRWSDEGDTAPPSKPIPMPTLVPMDRSNTPTNDYLGRRYSSSNNLGLLDDVGGSVHSIGSTEGSLSNDDLLLVLSDHSTKNATASSCISSLGSTSGTSQGSRQSQSTASSEGRVNGRPFRVESKPKQHGDSCSTWGTRTSPVTDLDLSLHLYADPPSTSNSTHKKASSGSKKEKTRRGQEQLQDSNQSLEYPLPNYLEKNRLERLRGRYDGLSGSELGGKTLSSTKDFVPSVPRRHKSGQSSYKMDSFFQSDDESDDGSSGSDDDDHAHDDSSGSLSRATMDEPPGGWQPLTLGHGMLLNADHHPSLRTTLLSPIHDKSMRRHSTTNLQHLQLNASLANFESLAADGNTNMEPSYDQPPSAPQRNVSGDGLPYVATTSTGESLLMLEDSEISTDIMPTLPIRNTSYGIPDSEEGDTLLTKACVPPLKPVRSPESNIVPEKPVARRVELSQPSLRGSQTSDATPTAPMRNVSDHNPLLTDDCLYDNDKASTDPSGINVSAMTYTDDDTSEEKVSSDSSFTEASKVAIHSNTASKRDSPPKKAVRTLTGSRRSLMSDLPRLISCTTLDLSCSEEASHSPVEKSPCSLQKYSLENRETEKNDGSSRDIVNEKGVSANASRHIQTKAPEPPSTSHSHLSSKQIRKTGSSASKEYKITQPAVKSAPYPPSASHKKSPSKNTTAGQFSPENTPVARRLPSASGAIATSPTTKAMEKRSPVQLPATGSPLESNDCAKKRPRFFKMFSWSGRSQARRPGFHRTMSSWSQPSLSNRNTSGKTAQYEGYRAPEEPQAVILNTSSHVALRTLSKQNSTEWMIYQLSLAMDQIFAGQSRASKEFEDSVCELQVAPLPQKFESERHRTAFLMNLFNLMVRHAVIISLEKSRTLSRWPKKLSELELFLSKSVAYNIGGEIIFAFDVHKALFKGTNIMSRSAESAMGNHLPWWKRLVPNAKTTFMLPQLTIDPRIVFAITYGTMSSSSVSTVHADSLESRLKSAAEQYCQTRITVKNKLYTCTIKLPHIFKWHRGILGGSKSTHAFVSSILKYLSQEQVDSLATGKWLIRYRKYNWCVQGPRQRQITTVVSPAQGTFPRRLSAIKENEALASPPKRRRPRVPREVLRHQQSDRSGISAISEMTTINSYPPIMHKASSGS